MTPRKCDRQFQSMGDAGDKKGIGGEKVSTRNRAHTRQHWRSQQLLEMAPVKPVGLEMHTPASVSQGVPEEGSVCGAGF